MKDYNQIAAKVIAALTKSLTDECLLCAAQVAANKKTINETQDINVILSAENIARYYEIRLQTVIEILERIGNIMKEEGVPILSNADILSIFECKSYEELKGKSNDPELVKRFNKNLKEYIKKLENEGEN